MHVRYRGSIPRRSTKNRFCKQLKILPFTLTALVGDAPTTILLCRTRLMSRTPLTSQGKSGFNSLVRHKATSYAKYASGQSAGAHNPTRKRYAGSNPVLRITVTNYTSQCRLARLSRLLWEQKIAGSNPATETKNVYSNQLPN